MIKFQLECTLREHKKGQYRIYIRETSMPQLRSIVAEHMDSWGTPIRGSPTARWPKAAGLVCFIKLKHNF